MPPFYPKQIRNGAYHQKVRPFMNMFLLDVRSFSKADRKLQASSLDEGSITISATETALHCCLLQAIESFRELHPNVTFRTS